MNLKTATAIALTAWLGTSTAHAVIMPIEPPPGTIGYTFSPGSLVTINSKTEAISGGFLYSPQAGIEFDAFITLTGPAPYGGPCFQDTEFAGPKVISANCPPTQQIETQFFFADALSNVPDTLIGLSNEVGTTGLVPATGSVVPGGFVADVPEPSSLTLLGAALGLLLVRRSLNGKRLSGGASE